MNKQIERLLNNVKILAETNALDTLEVIAYEKENEGVDSISYLNELIESEMSYWER